MASSQNLRMRESKDSVTNVYVSWKSLSAYK